MLNIKQTLAGLKAASGFIRSRVAEKINLRITTERLTQKEKTYKELQGKPVEKTKEEKEKELREHKKAVKNHKLSDPIIRKKGKICFSKS